MYLWVDPFRCSFFQALSCPVMDVVGNGGSGGKVIRYISLHVFSALMDPFHEKSPSSNQTTIVLL